jgi:hypothetical protein
MYYFGYFLQKNTGLFGGVIPQNDKSQSGLVEQGKSLTS